MTNASLKEQLKAVAGQISTAEGKGKSSKHKKKASGSRPPQARQPKQPKIKPAWLDYVQYGVELLKVYFPKAFFPVEHVKPLKKGIKEELVKKLSTLQDVATDDKVCMVKSLSYYVNTMAYLKKVTEGAVRVDLDGGQAEPVSTEEAKYSAERLSAKVEARKKSKSQPTPDAKATTKEENTKEAEPA